MLHVAAACAAYLAGRTTRRTTAWKTNIITEPFLIQSGRIAVPSRPGLGIEVDPEKLRQYRIDC